MRGPRHSTTGKRTYVSYEVCPEDLTAIQKAILHVFGLSHLIWPSWWTIIRMFPIGGLQDCGLRVAAGGGNGDCKPPVASLKKALESLGPCAFLGLGAARRAQRHTPSTRPGAYSSPQPHQAAIASPPVPITASNRSSKLHKLRITPAPIAAGKRVRPSSTSRVCPTKVVVGQEHRAGGFEVRQFLREGKRKPGEPLH